MAGAAIRAGQFEKGIAEIGTLLDGDVKGQMAAMRGELMDMSIEFGQTMGSMTKARYDIISAGFTDAADSAMVLEASSKLAVAGVSDVASTADLLTTALNGLGLEADQAGAVSDVLFQTVRKGKTTISDLAASMGPLFATAKTAGIGLEELAGFMATTTAKGINTRESVTAMNQMMLALAAPTGAAGKKLKELGISLDKGIVPAMQALSEVSEDGLDALAAVIPNIRALKAASTAAQDVEMLTDNMDAMVDSVGVTDDGFKLMAETFDFKSKQMGNALDALVIEVGTELLPAFTDIVSRLTEVAKWFRENKEAVFTLASQMIPLIEKAVKIGLAFLAMSRVFLVVRQATLLMNRQMFKIIIVVGGLIAAVQGLRKIFPELMQDFDLVDKAAKGFGDAIAELEKKFPVLQGLFSAITGDTKEVTDALNDADAALRNLGGEGAGGEAVGALSDQASAATTFMDDLGEQTKITAEDVANLGFSVASQLGGSLANAAAGLLGLRAGAMSFGEAMKGVLASILAMITQMIVKMIAAKALMAAFGGPLSFLGFARGGEAPTAARGLSVAGSSGGGRAFGAGMILPGMPGSDRTLVAASGGEIFTPRAEANYAERMLMKTITSPRREGGKRGGIRAKKPTIEMKVDRPFRREEQIRLRSSIIDADDRAGKYRV